MPQYLLTVSDKDARLLESWLGSQVILAPAHGDGADPLADLRVSDGHVPDYHRAEAGKRLAALGPVPVAGLDAITVIESALARERLSRSGPLYHAGGPSGVMPPEPANAYEAASQRLAAATENHRLALIASGRIIQQADREYRDAETELRQHESKPGIPLPEYQEG
jgi:hypothetical protein